MKLKDIMLGVAPHTIEVANNEIGCTFVPVFLKDNWWYGFDAQYEPVQYHQESSDWGVVLDAKVVS